MADRPNNKPWNIVEQLMAALESRPVLLVSGVFLLIVGAASIYVALERGRLNDYVITGLFLGIGTWNLVQAKRKSKDRDAR